MTKSAEELNDVKTFFHGYAGDFDSIYGHEKGRSLFDKITDKLFRQSMYTRFQKTLQDSQKQSINTILDVGCGSGHFCEALLKQGKTITGLDIAEGMLEIAKSKTKAFIESGKANFVLSGYLEHTFDTKFDAACLMGFFDYIKEPVLIFNKIEKDVSKEVYMSFPKKGGFLAWQRKIRYEMRNCPLFLYSKEDLKKHLNEAGWAGKYEITDLGRDYYVKVCLEC